MSEIIVPFSISYQTDGTTPVADIIAALHSTDHVMREAVSLLPSLIDGLSVSGCSLNVRIISQESPLKELFGIALIVAFQDELKTEIPPMLESLLGITIDDKYDSVVTVTFMTVLFYGVSFAKDAILKKVENHRPRQMLDDLVATVARQLGKSEKEVMQVLEAKFSKPNVVKRLVKETVQFFLPSQKALNAPILIDRAIIDTPTVREVPYTPSDEAVTDYDRYTPMNGVDVEVHAMDKDKNATGWAAVVPSVSEKRLKMRLMDPLSSGDVFGIEKLIGDIVVVSKLTSEGFVPAEFQLIAIST